MDEANTPKNAPRGALLGAFAASVAMHALLLGLLRLPAHHAASQPELVVTLTGSFVARSAAPPPREPSAPATGPVRPRDQGSPQPVRSASTARAAAAPASAPSRPPVPRGEPFAGRTWPEVAGRRLAATVRLNPDGTVAEAFVKPNEIGPEVVQVLEQALSKLRFRPGTAGSDGTAELDTRLCFDEQGRLDTGPQECWPNGIPSGR